ncbi:proton-activated chloride channel [Brachionichthys hirsutus]|uniref:proton-activated chloride channel n=1 Tax=Brachionichthys hirsutus TaxID=412623 RepID=UPI00360430ED
MLGKEQSKPYKEFNDEDEDDDKGDARSSGFYSGGRADPDSQDPNGSIISNEDEVKGNAPSMRVSKTCLKTVFTAVLINIYVLLTAVAAFVAYQTVSDFLEKLNNPVMSVIYKEFDMFPPPGIALYPGNAELLSCNHYYHDNIPPLVDPGKPQKTDCVIEEVTYFGPFTTEKEKKALVIRGPTDVRKKELIFIQFSQNETKEDFSAITYMLFARFSDLTDSENKSTFMRECERNYSKFTFSGGFRTKVKMTLVTTSGEKNQGVEFKQESSVVKFNDKRPESEKTNELFFAVFEWRDPFMQEIRLIVTANPWNSLGILCGFFLALVKAAGFANSAIAWIIKMRKRQLRNKTQELNQITDE